MTPLLAALIALAIGLALVVSGVQAYRGKYLSWLALQQFFPGWPGLAGLYLGIAFTAIGLAMVGRAAAGEPAGALAGLAALVAFPCLVVGIVGMFWLPSFLLPRWVKDTREEIRRGESLSQQALRPGGALHGRIGVPRHLWPENQPGGRDGGDAPRGPGGPGERA